MGRFLLKRLANYVVLVVVATTLAYIVASLALNPRSTYEGRNPPPPAAVVEQQLTAYGVNDKDPLLGRYADWIGGVVLHGDFGQTVRGQDINDQLGSRALVSLRLLVLGSIIGAVVGVLAGVVSAIKKYKVTDRAITAYSFFFIATPVFFTAVLLKFGALSVNDAVGSTVLYYTGYETPNLQAGFWGHVADQVGHLILPTLSIALGQIAYFSRYQRNAMLDVMNSDFLRTAEAKGLTRRKALYKHGLRTALIPMATLLAYSFGTLAVGATFTEKIFGWHGMGEWLVDSITSQDINVVATVTLFTAVFILISGFLADVIYAVLDPRVRV
ncbi:peptide/nickel transport system permease protein [Klenkia soli]|uniref:Peptide/nickel transport system permease protein n=1 Tax=Klenkia soli TaxID=1052260 RepID=A0A1H0CBQ5_9ACTN|nr:ABC transporter permease [Klenkia soli]SDN55344.1 peptide/nickel transport system permease protein [Klenkia soli]